MGRGKIEIKRIENVSNRQITFTKRKNGILKKAKELHILCEVDVAIIIFNSSGNMTIECLNRNEESGLTGILQKIPTCSETRLWDSNHENLISEIENLRKENEMRRNELRHLKGEDLQPLEINHLQTIENALDRGHVKAREKLAECMEKMYKNDNDLLMEHLHLKDCLHNQELRKQNGYQRNQFASQMPSSFRVQPNHPNLQNNNK